MGKKCKPTSARYTACVVILGIILLFWCGLLMAYWCAVAARVWLLAQDPPTVRHGLDRPTPPNGWPKLTIIVPVHNEQRVITACAASLRAQNYPNLEIIFVLDRCTDRTRELLENHTEDPRLIIIDNETCPEDWAGKCHAAHLGAQRATGQFLLFTDADTEFHSDLSRAAVSLAIERDAPLLSLLSSLTYSAWHEKIAQPVATMALMRLYPLTRLSERKRPRPFANGQFMLFDRAVYDRLGGHIAVKDDLLEDLAFARLVHDQGGDCTVLLADGLLQCSMYDSLTAFERGWRRIFVEACRRRTRRLRKHAWRLVFLGLFAPLAQIAALAVAWWMPDPLLAGALAVSVFGGWVAQCAALLVIYRLSGAPLSAILAYPAGCLVVSRLLFQGAADLDQHRPVIWGGREYVLEPR